MVVGIAHHLLLFDYLSMFTCYLIVCRFKTYKSSKKSENSETKSCQVIRLVSLSLLVLLYLLNTALVSTVLGQTYNLDSYQVHYLFTTTGTFQHLPGTVQQ